VSANSPIDQVIGIRWDLSPHASSYCFEKNCKVYFILVKMSPGNLLEIIAADLAEKHVIQYADH